MSDSDTELEVRCGECDFINLADAELCISCAQPLNPVAKATRNRQCAPGSHDGSPRSRQYGGSRLLQCPYCTYHNSISNRVCEMCSKTIREPPSPSPSGPDRGDQALFATTSGRVRRKRRKERRPKVENNNHTRTTNPIKCADDPPEEGQTAPAEERWFIPRWSSWLIVCLMGYLRQSWQRLISWSNFLRRKHGTLKCPHCTYENPKPTRICNMCSKTIRTWDNAKGKPKTGPARLFARAERSLPLYIPGMFYTGVMGFLRQFCRTFRKCFSLLNFTIRFL